jgi:UDP-GlcNAc:undecaprenyl-phosphate/decaprenyl-phosphate GlcNAc-1-phosphate transferase
MLIELTIAAIASQLLAVALCRLTGLVDQPDHRKQHESSIPLAGGIAVFLSFLYATYKLQLPPLSHEMVGLMTVVFVLGVLDDRINLSPAWRLVLHYVIGILMATWAGIVIVNVGNLLAMGDIPLLLLAIPLTALSFAGLANAYNMIDGIDGLAGATVAIPLGILALLAYSAGHPMALTLTAVLVPLAVYLCFNLGPNNRLLPQIFLGDAGSVTLGFMVCAALVYFSQGSNQLIEPVTALWLVALPLMDMLATMARRIKNGHHPMAADRCHLHHSLLAMGFRPREVLLLLAAFSLLCAVVGLALESAPAYFSLLVYCLLFLAYLVFAIRSQHMGEKVRKYLQRPAT